MSSSSPSTTETSPAGAVPAPERIFLISYPKIVLLYPTLLAALVAGLVMWFTKNASGEDRPITEIVAICFLLVTGLNLVVFAFDFPRTTSLTVFFFAVALIIGLALLFRVYPDLLPIVSDWLKKFRPWANAHFYFAVVLFMIVIYLAVLVNVRFDYWEVRPNELLHHHGVLSDMERFSAPHLKIDKEITDIFEYMLLRSGRLILHPSNEPRAIVLENVPFINSKEEQITRMLSALQVQIRTDNN